VLPALAIPLGIARSACLAIGQPDDVGDALPASLGDQHVDCGADAELAGRRIVVAGGNDKSTVVLTGAGPQHGDRIRRSRKQRYITVDLGFPSRRWKSKSDQDIKVYFAELVETGLLCFARRLDKDKAQIDLQRLISDFGAAKAEFLAG